MNQRVSRSRLRAAVATMIFLAIAPAGAARAGDLRFTSDYAAYEDGSQAMISIDNLGPTEDGGVPLPGCSVSVSVVDQAGAVLSTQVVNGAPRIANIAPATLPPAVSGIGYVRFEATYAKSSYCTPKLLRVQAIVLPVPQPTNPARQITTMTRWRVASLMK